MKSSLTKNCLEFIVIPSGKKVGKSGSFWLIWGGFCFEASVQSI
jgi:hypothetical protein